MAAPISCLVVDDEPLACQLLERFISRVASLQHIGTCTNAIDAIDAVRLHQPALLFLDIEMPELSGLDLLNTLPANRPQIVLTTAFPNYALEGFNYDVTDYLLKPIRFERFLRAVNRVHARLGLAPDALPASLPPLPEANSELTAPVLDPNLWLNVNKKQIRLPMTDIVLIESMRDYTYFHLMNQSVRIHTALSKIEQLLSPAEFVRINRSFIVRCGAIVAIKANAVELINKKQLPIGVTYRELVKERLKC